MKFILVIFMTLILSSCGGGGGKGTGGGLIKGAMQAGATLGVLAGNQIQLNFAGGNEPFTYQITNNILGCSTNNCPPTLDTDCACIDQSGLISIPPYTSRIDIVTSLTIRVIDRRNSYSDFNITLLGDPDPWFKADAVQPADMIGSMVAQWIDQSGHNHHAIDAGGSLTCTTASPNDCPVLNSFTSGMNGKATLTFNSTNSTSLVFPRTISDDFTIALVMKTENPGTASASPWHNSNGIIDSFSAAVPGQFGIAMQDNGLVHAGIRGGAEQNLDSSASAIPAKNDGVGHVVIFTRDRAGGTIELWIDGILQQTNGAADTSTLNANADIAIGRLLNSTNYFNGNIGEIILYGHYMGGGANVERGELENYLANRYDVGHYPIIDSVLINSGVFYTKNLTVSISIASSEPSPSQLCIREDTNYNSCSWVAYANPKSFNVSAGDGVKNIYVWMKNSAGGVTPASYYATSFITLDQTPPTGAISITTPVTPGGYTSNTSVNFVWNSAGCGDGVGSGVSSNYYVKIGTIDNGTNKFVGTLSVTNKTVTCNTGETCYARIYCVDNIGNVSVDPNYDSSNIIVDTVAPFSTSISINGGAGYINNTAVTLTLAATNAYQMYITNTAGCGADGAWEAYNTTKAWALGQTNGTATVYIKYRNPALVESGCINSTIIHDNIDPVASAISINSDAIGTNNTTVSINITYTETNPYQLCIREDTNFASCTWVAWGNPKSFILSSGDGLKNVYLWIKDAAGNNSVTYATDSIYLDFIAPTAASDIILDDITVFYTSGSAIIWNWTMGSDGGSGLNSIAAYSLYTYSSFANCSAHASGVMQWSGTTNYSGAISNIANGTYYISVATMDNAANISWSTCSAAFIVDRFDLIALPSGGFQAGTDIFSDIDGFGFSRTDVDPAIESGPSHETKGSFILRRGFFEYIAY